MADQAGEGRLLGSGNCGGAQEAKAGGVNDPLANKRMMGVH
ncbi:hypothetical protein OHA70_32075 [Kribbella sp. NBC_00382]